VKQIYELYSEKYDPESYLSLKGGEVDKHKLKTEVKYVFFNTFDETITIKSAAQDQMCVLHVKKY
jgi:hypothetical protein